MNNKGSKLKALAMRWRFRLDHARAIFGMLTFALLLAVGYVDILPWFMDQGFWRGEFLLTFLVLTVFVIGGYLYDRGLKLWSEDITVRVERNPYTYMPGPKEHLIKKSVDYAIMYLLSKNEETKEEAKSLKKILDEYYSLTPNTEGYREKSEEIKTLTNQFTNKIKEMIE